MPLSSDTGSDVQYYQITDHLGSVRVIKDGEGTVLQRFDYYPFGSESRVWTAGTNTPQSVLRYRFGGKEIAGQSHNSLKPCLLLLAQAPVILAAVNACKMTNEMPYYAWMAIL